MLSVSAFNALLKTLEEPPPHVAFILATTEIHKVPATVASRCQRFDFRRVPLKSMVDRLRWVCDRENIEVEDAALELVARQSTGSLRDALSLMDQLRVFSEGSIKLTEVQDMLGASGSERVADFVDCLVSADLAAGLRLINAVLDEGLDIRQFNRQTVEHLRQLMLIKSGAANSSEASLLDVTAEMKQRMDGQSARVDLPDLLRWTKIFASADGELRSTSYRQLPLEMALVEAILPPTVAVRPAGDLDAQASSERPRPAQPTPIQQSPPRPQQQPRPTVHNTPIEPQLSSAPPPIHADLSGFLNGNASHQPAEAAASQDQRDLETVPVANGHTEAPPEEAPGVDLSDNADDGDEFGKLQRLWPHLVDQINARSKQMAAVFRDNAQVRPYAVSGKTVTISFRYPIHAQRARGDQQRALLEQVLARTLGHPCLLEAITFDQEGNDSGDDGNGSTGGSGGNGGQPASNKPKNKPPSPSETPRGRAAMNTFEIEKFELTDE
jgi:DNA polymerase-3 subunit gamma/tau